MKPLELIRSIMRIEDQYRTELPRAIVEGCKALLDVGCGSNSPIQYVSDRLGYTVGVDAHEPSIEMSRTRGIHTKYVVCNVLDIGSVFSERSLDCVLLSDVIEHFGKEDGQNIIKMAEGIS